MKKNTLVQMSHKICITCVLMFSVSCSSLEKMNIGCRFKYSDEFKNKSVIPLLSEKLGISYLYYTYDDPAIIRKKNKVELIFSPTKKVDGMTLLSERSFVMVVNACNSNIIEAYETEGVDAEYTIKDEGKN